MALVIALWCGAGYCVLLLSSCTLCDKGPALCVRALCYARRLCSEGCAVPTVVQTSAVQEHRRSTAVLAGRAVRPVRTRESVIPSQSRALQCDAPVTGCYESAFRAGHSLRGLDRALLRRCSCVGAA